MKIIIECTKKEKHEWIKYNKSRCPFAPCFTKNCDDNASCNKCIEDNIRFNIIDALMYKTIDEEILIDKEDEILSSYETLR